MFTRRTDTYVIGRAMWGGKGMNLTGRISLVTRLKYDAGSPWVLSPLSKNNKFVFISKKNQLDEQVKN